MDAINITNDRRAICMYSHGKQEEMAYIAVGALFPFYPCPLVLQTQVQRQIPFVKDWWGGVGGLLSTV